LLPVSKAEKQAVLAVLEAAESSTEEDVDQVLADVCRAAYAAREKRKQFTVVIPAKGLSRCYETFPTHNAAVKFIHAGKLPALKGEKAFVVPLYHKEME